VRCPIGRNVRPFAMALFASMMSATPAGAYTLWSTSATYLGTGEFHGPGASERNPPLFATVIRNIMFLNARDFVVPFASSATSQPGFCGSRSLPAHERGRLSDGSRINTNIETCATVIGGMRVFPATIGGGLYMGEDMSAISDDGNITMAMDLAMDLGAARHAVIKMQFYATTGEVTVPLSSQTQAGGHGVDQAGIYQSGLRLRGRVGDFNHDGWIDGTLVAAGVMPLDSPLYPGQPYVMVRHFETDIPVDGEWSSNVAALRHSAIAAPSDEQHHGK